MKQSKLQSFIEACTTVGSGMLVALAIQLLIFPLYDIQITMFENLQLVIIFTTTALLRVYIIRRFFNNIKHAFKIIPIWSKPNIIRKNSF